MFVRYFISPEMYIILPRLNNTWIISAYQNSAWMVSPHIQTLYLHVHTYIISPHMFHIYEDEVMAALLSQG